ncbi:hypothetical protein B0T17DRAFT_615306 [Bombardia bombarda]|uniref:Uncharacterized protein n=1 Tax=Bombardia bombarda TaxID=252184 RepID=A0AA39X905_9PEZI|nr:hypothetical protein B0T17DRAFT_615306 [Bombardia bombarda]
MPPPASANLDDTNRMSEQTQHGGKKPPKKSLKRKNKQSNLPVAKGKQNEVIESHEAHEVQEGHNGSAVTVTQTSVMDAAKTHTEDANQTTTYAEPVTHETIKPHVHEVREEQIQREIHTHDVYHREQPVYDIEVRPARHFVPDGSGGLTEVAAKDLPGCTGENQKWYIGEERSRNAPLHPENSQIPADGTAHRVGDGANVVRYTTAEGVQRTEDVVVHPRELERVSTADGPVLPIHFDKNGQGHTQPLDLQRKPTEVEQQQQPLNNVRSADRKPGAARKRAFSDCNVV